MEKIYFYFFHRKVPMKDKSSIVLNERLKLPRMNIYVALPYDLQLPRLILDHPKIDGITVMVNLSNFLFNEQDYYIGYLTQYLYPAFKQITDSGKEIALAVCMGSRCGNAIYNPTGYVQMTAQRQGSGVPFVVKLPLFWQDDYLDKITDFTYWLATNLKASAYWDDINHIKLTWANQDSAETRATQQDWAYTNDGNQAFKDAANKWIDAGYSNQKVVDSFNRIAGVYRQAYADKRIVLVLIGGKSGFPCVSDTGTICLPKERPLINYRLINELKKYANVGVQSNTLDFDKGTPVEITSSGLPFNFQVKNNLYGENVKAPYPKPAAEQDAFKQVLLNGQSHGAEIVEVFKTTIVAYPEAFI